MHKKILELIENVDPNDADALDEIDARVACWLNGHEYNKSMIAYYIGADYTRSRDSLKAIRPEGWGIMLVPWTKNGQDINSYTATLTHPEHDPFFTYQAKPEELAELHAIIQAIAFDRTSDRTPV